MKYPSNYLCHYGILGQKWGIRRFQNEDGSYTPEGKDRYGKMSGLFRKKNELPFDTVSRKQVQKDFNSVIAQNKEFVNQLKKVSNELVAKQDSLTMKYGDYLNSQALSKRDKDDMWKSLREATNDYEPFEEKDFFYEDVQVIAEEKAKQKFSEAPDKLKKEAEAFDASVKQYFKDVHKIAEQVVSKHKNQYVEDMYSREKEKSYLPVDWAVDEFLKDELKSPFLYSNIYASSDSPSDRWVYNTKAFSQTLAKYVDKIGDEFTIDEYYKRYGYV